MSARRAVGLAAALVLAVFPVVTSVASGQERTGDRIGEAIACIKDGPCPFNPADTTTSTTTSTTTTTTAPAGEPVVPEPSMGTPRRAVQPRFTG